MTRRLFAFTVLLTMCLVACGQVNGVMRTLFEDESGVFVEKEYNLLCEATDNRLVITGFLGYTDPVVFDTDLSTMTAVAKNQVAFSDANLGGTFYYADYDLISFAPGKREINARIALSDTSTQLDITNRMLCTEMGNMYKDRFYNTSIVCDFVLGQENGVSEIECEKNVPLYFDLMGNKVESPERGVFIKCEGNIYNKVIIK